MQWIFRFIKTNLRKILLKLTGFDWSPWYSRMAHFCDF